MLLDKLMLGLKVSVVGMLVTFFGLVILILLVHANRWIAESINKTGKKKEVKPQETKKPVKTTDQPKVERKAAKGNNEIMAAITAAVSLMMENKPFKVKSVKKSTTSSVSDAWEIVAIQEQNNNL